MKTQDLKDSAFDWAVAKCEGYDCEFGDGVSGPWLVPQEGYLHDEKPLSSFRPSTTGEPMGTDAQEATAWRPKAENLEREIKPLRLYENLAKEYGILVFEGLEELQRENAALRDALQGAVSMAKDAHGHWDEDRDAKVGKHLLALAGANKGYDKRADAIHAALASQGEKP